jgi:hypothetical protein
MDEQGTTVQDLTAPKRVGRPPKNPELKISDLPKEEMQEQPRDKSVENGLREQINELKEALRPFAKIPAEPNEPPTKKLFHLCRGLEEADIINGDIIRARKLV